MRQNNLSSLLLHLTTSSATDTYEMACAKSSSYRKILKKSWFLSEISKIIIFLTFVDFFLI